MFITVWGGGDVEFCFLYASHQGSGSLSCMTRENREDELHTPARTVNDCIPICSVVVMLMQSKKKVMAGATLESLW